MPEWLPPSLVYVAEFMETQCTVEYFVTAKEVTDSPSAWKGETKIYLD